MELKPCPFCGGEAFLYVDDGVRVYCSSCNASSQILRDGKNVKNKPFGNATKSVIEAWNRRHNENI